MFNRTAATTVSLVLATSITLAPLVGCENLPGGKKEQGAVIGGVAGAAAGALIGKKNRGVGALIGGLLGAGGGYLIGANQEKIDKDKKDEARQASDRAARSPASRNDVFKSSTADLNNDGFVTLDEVAAMQQANLSDEEMIDRLRRTDQVFELTSQQQNWLRDRGVSQRVVDEMLRMNHGPDATTASGVRPSDRVGSSDRY
jgi:hypothetical protein